jgi:hypothetical protein
MTIRNYQDLIAWQKAMTLAEAVYRATGEMPVEERYGITSQMRRAAVSIPSNVAEGKGAAPTASFSTSFRLPTVPHESSKPKFCYVEDWPICPTPSFKRYWRKAPRSAD